MMRADFTNLLYLILAVSSVYCAANDDDDSEKSGKLISTFQIVRFPNEVCVGSNSRNGTCYTSAECSDKDGTSSGSCADGFGVCCTFVINTCGSSTSENITYWTSPSTVSSGSCDLSVCPVADDICQLRLDFTTFVTTGPSFVSIVQVRRRFGQPVGDHDDTLYDKSGSTYSTNCLTDSFHAQGASASSNPPMVCGVLTGEHMDMDSCNRLKFNFGDGVQTADSIINHRGIFTLATRSWDITATQIECGNVLLPPVGCTQYYHGSGSYLIQSYNWQASGTSTHLASQHQRICIRRERGYCVGCFVAADALFHLSGDPQETENTTAVGGCCGYGTQWGAGILGEESAQSNSMGLGSVIAGSNVYNYGYDCVIIPGAQVPAEGTVGTVSTTQTATYLTQTLLASNYMPMHSPPQICGGGKGLGIGHSDLSEAAKGTTAVGTAIIVTTYTTKNNYTICTRNNPFVLEFMADDLEGQGGEQASAQMERLTKASNRGFQILSSQLACT